MKLVLLQTLCFAILWVTVAPTQIGPTIYRFSQAEAQGLPLKSSLTKGLRLAAPTPPPADDNFYLGGGSENPQPCMWAKNMDAYKNFKHRHLIHTPSTQDWRDWMMFLREHNLCNRSTQSFLHPKDESLINKVCTPEGGKVYKENLCISNHNFSFTKVMIGRNNCTILRITNKIEHIILACSKIGEVCRPVHFEGNPNNQVPNSTAPGCSNRWPASGAP